MAAARTPSIFKTNKRIRLGLWGLGRGMSFYHSAKALNFDVVAGCDYNQHMRENFLQHNPGAVATADAAEFLKMDFDAVVLATFCPAHADDAIACLDAGKHVMSEVTSFHTLAEGVRLVEAVERSGKVYNLAENYPFSAANTWLARKWREGLFGELMYGEYEYVHECRSLAYTYIDGTPIVPGNQTHSWRSWLNFHYYNTHSLGPMMHITGLRPTRVVALPGKPSLPGYPLSKMGMGGVGPSLINMSNGSIVRNLMGATTNDTHCQRLWGTKGSADMSHGDLRLRLGGAGHSPMFTVTPEWDELGEVAAKTGHGGGDFWVLYHFARQILEGVAAPFDIYNACDCTIPGLLAFRSAMENGRPLDVPDMRDKSQRDAVRDDHYAQERFDHRKGLFPEGADESLTKQFSLTMRDLINTSLVYRAFRDWTKVTQEMNDPGQVVALADRVMTALPRLNEVQKIARQIVDRYPESVGGRVLGEMLALSDEPITTRPDYLKKLKAERAKLTRTTAALAAARARRQLGKPADKWVSPFLEKWRISNLRARKGDVASAPAARLSQRLGWMPLSDASYPHFVNAHALLGERDGIAYLATRIKVAKRSKWDLLLGYDGGVRVFVDGKSVFCDPKRINPAKPDRASIALDLKPGVREIVVALDTDKGMGWGIYARLAVPKALRKKGKPPLFPEVV